MTYHKPDAAALKAAEQKLLPDLIAPGLKVLFCGINPSLYSAAVGLHFARPGNRFWPALYAGGFTEHVYKPQEQRRLLEKGCGITNVVERASTAAAELSVDEIRSGAARLQQKLQQYQPSVVAVLGITVFRSAFEVKKAAVGLQNMTIGSTRVWVLPNPSGLNAHYTPRQLGVLFSDLCAFVKAPSSAASTPFAP